MWTVVTLPFTEYKYMYITAAKSDYDAGSISNYEAETREHAKKVEEFQKKQKTVRK
jgi:hypothetical protein